MPISVSAFQIFDYYLSNYRSREKENKKENDKKSDLRSYRYDTHNYEELKNLYSAIQLRNRFSPVYLSEPSPKSIAYAVYLKESARSLTQKINSLSGVGSADLFGAKNTCNTNPSLAKAEYVPEDAEPDMPQSFTLNVERFASPQENTGAYLDSNEAVGLAPGSYSFDLLTNKLHYELQFSVAPGEKNSELQNKLCRLINNSELGIHARVDSKDSRSALIITSDALGLPFGAERHFSLTEDSTTYDKGVIDYLGLNGNIKEAANAVYTIDDEEFSSYSNKFTVFGGFHIELLPDTASDENTSEKMTARIGLETDAQSLSENIDAFVDEYNNFMHSTLPFDDDAKKGDYGREISLNTEMYRFLSQHRQDLEVYGISINEDASLDYDKELMTDDFTGIKRFGNQILDKLDLISIDPMEYIDRRICAYPNPRTSFVNPYMTSIYTGMLFSTWV